MPEHLYTGTAVTEAKKHTSAAYSDAGVNISVGNALVESFKEIAKRTVRPEILAGAGNGFAALFTLPEGYQSPVLVAGTDGVGTKLKLAIALDRHEVLGQDLVAMSVNDVLSCGAEPLIFLDYFAAARLDPDIAVRVVEGISDACLLAGCTLAGGETAEMPGLYQKNDYDLAGFCLGVVEQSAIINGKTIQANDVLIGIRSSGPHANGFSLIRMILDNQKIDLTKETDLAESLLQPTRIYSKVLHSLKQQVPVLGISHITGGGLTENLPRMLAGQSLDLEVEINSWEMPSVFCWLQQAGNIEDREMRRTFNCGIGMVFCIREKDQAKALHALQALGEEPVVLGRVTQSRTETEQQVHFAT